MNTNVDRHFLIWRILLAFYLVFYAYEISPFFKDVFMLKYTSDDYLPDLWLFLVAGGGIFFVGKPTLRVGSGMLLSSFLFLLFLNPLTTSPEVSFLKLLFSYLLLFKHDPKAPLYWLNLSGSFIYFFAGIAKIMTPHWVDGGLLHSILDTSMTRSFGVTSWRSFSSISLFISWTIILLHLLSPLVCSFKAALRPYHYLMLSQYIFAFFFTYELHQVLFGMIFYHTFFIIHSFKGEERHLRPVLKRDQKRAVPMDPLATVSGGAP